MLLYNIRDIILIHAHTSSKLGDLWVNYANKNQHPGPMIDEAYSAITGLKGCGP